MIIKAFPVSETFVNNRFPVSRITATCRKKPIIKVNHTIFTRQALCQFGACQIGILKKAQTELTLSGLKTRRSKNATPASISDHIFPNDFLFSNRSSSLSSKLIKRPHPTSYTQIQVIKTNSESKCWQYSKMEISKY